MNEDDDQLDLDFYDVFGEPRAKTIPDVLKKERKDKGVCPECSELGYFSNFQYVCKVHGPY